MPVVVPLHDNSINIITKRFFWHFLKSLLKDWKHSFHRRWIACWVASTHAKRLQVGNSLWWAQKNGRMSFIWKSSACRSWAGARKMGNSLFNPDKQTKGCGTLMHLKMLRSANCWGVGQISLNLTGFHSHAYLSPELHFMGQVNSKLLVELREAWLNNTNNMCYEAFSFWAWVWKIGN